MANRISKIWPPHSDLRALVENHGFEFVETFERPRLSWRGAVRFMRVYMASFRKVPNPGSRV